MKLKNLTTLFLICLIVYKVKAQNPYGEYWYQNPLGFNPIKLHTSMGFLLPAVTVGTCLLLSNDSKEFKKKFSIYSEIAPSYGYKYPYTFLPQFNTGFNYELRKFMSIGVEFGAIFPHDSYNKTFGLDIKPFARFYPINHKNWRLFFESGGGLVFTADEFPLPNEKDNRLGLQLNGITKYGLGAEINTSAHTAVLFGIRHVHLSNGNAKGVERNPSHDSNGFFIGMSHTLR